MWSCFLNAFALLIIKDTVYHTTFWDLWVHMLLLWHSVGDLSNKCIGSLMMNKAGALGRQLPFLMYRKENQWFQCLHNSDQPVSVRCINLNTHRPIGNQNTTVYVVSFLPLDLKVMCTQAWPSYYAYTFIIRKEISQADLWIQKREILISLTTRHANHRWIAIISVH